jgi:hypothetical protein
MRHYLFSILLIFVFGVYFNVNAQSIFKEFRTLEERVKHVQPDRLLIFSRSIDTSKQLGGAISHWAKGKFYFWNSDYPKAYAQLDKAAQIIVGRSISISFFFTCGSR